MLSAEKALKRLKEGNARFISGAPSREGWVTQAKREQVAEAQEPFAVILGCSDSRVPAEIVFDQGLGDLFVIRVAGNIVKPSQIGSIEFATTTFDSKLIVVLGHSNCGAIVTAVNELCQLEPQRSPNLRTIVEFIKPSVESLLEANGTDSPREQLIADAVRANVRTSMEKIKRKSQIIQRLIEEEGVKIVGAEYNLQTGEVDFFEEG